MFSFQEEHEHQKPTALTNKKQKELVAKNVLKIKVFQLLVFDILIALLAIIVSCVVVTNNNYQNALPDTNKAEYVFLSDLNANATTYMTLGSEQDFASKDIFLYQIEDGKINVYKIYNANRFNSSGTELLGKATVAQIRVYFGVDLKQGLPGAYTIFPEAKTILIVSSVTGAAVLLVLLFGIRKLAQQTMKLCEKLFEPLSKLAEQYANDEELSNAEYNKKRKEYFSDTIIENKNIMKIYKFLY